MKKPWKTTETTGTIRITKLDLRQLDQAIRDQRKNGERAARGGDKELADQYATDVEDLTYFRNAVARGDYDTARHAAYNMDTCVRDLIPAEMYNRLHPEN